MKELFEQNIHLVGKVMDLRLQRQNVVMANVANVNTPKYKARKLAFEEDLQSALQLDAKGRMTRTSQMHMPAEFDVNGVHGKGIADFKPRTVYGEDVVDLDKEMAAMAKNGMMYNALSDVISKSFTGLQTVIAEGSK